MTCMFFIFNFVLIFTMFCACKNSVSRRYKRKYDASERTAPYNSLEDNITEIIYHSANVNKRPKLILQHDYG